MPITACESWKFNEEKILENYKEGKVSYIISTEADFLEPYIIKEKKTTKKKSANTAGCKMKQGRIDALLGGNLRVQSPQKSPDKAPATIEDILS